MTDFWKTFEKPFFALAPMEDVTDTVFREVILSVSTYGNPKVLFTEFTSVDGLCHPKGREAVIHRLKVNETERELLKQHGRFLVAQIWGNNPEIFFRASKFIAENFNFDGIDINMGCPIDKIIKQGACSALIGQHALVSDIIQATREGSKLPVSVKTRTGIKEHTTVEWITHLMSCDLSAITLHARTRKMMSQKPAEWEQVQIAARLCRAESLAIQIIGNGDVESYEHGLQLIETTGANGVMIGRGVFSNPWFFADTSFIPSITEKLDLLEKHIVLFTDTWETSRNYNILKRFFKIYVNGFEGAAALRAHLMETHHAGEALSIINNFRNSQSNPIV